MIVCFKKRKCSVYIAHTVKWDQTLPLSRQKYAWSIRKTKNERVQMHKKKTKIKQAAGMRQKLVALQVWKGCLPKSTFGTLDVIVIRSCSTGLNRSRGYSAVCRHGYQTIHDAGLTMEWPHKNSRRIQWRAMSNNHSAVVEFASNMRT